MTVESKETTTEPKVEPKVEAKEEPKDILGAAKKEEPKGPPEKYEFKAPEHWAKEGWELDVGLIEKATPMFKELGLSNDQAQKLMDFYAAQSEADHKSSMDSIKTQNDEWMKALKQDPEIGGKLDAVKTNIARMLDGLGDQKLKADFQQAMTETGMGNHPTFVKLFAKLSERFTEGKLVSGRGPVEVKQPGGQPASAAKAMYPNLA